MTDTSSREHALEQRVLDEWPFDLCALFDGTALEQKVGFTASLSTLDANGHLRTSLLSVGELYAPDARRLCFALWPSSRAARSLMVPAPGRKHAQAALTFVHDGAFYQVQLKVTPLASGIVRANVIDTTREHEPEQGLACYIASIEMLELQRVGYADLTSGIAFELEEGEGRGAVLARWQRQVENLRQAAGRAAGAQDSR
jgi:hypothetical protein